MEVGKSIDSVSRATVVSRNSDGGSHGPRVSLAEVVSRSITCLIPTSNA